MSNNNKMPHLRFPGFTGEWKEQPLSNFLFEHKTKSDGRCKVHSVSVTKGVIDQVEYLGRSFAAADTSKYNLAKPNDIIYTKSPTGDFPYGIVKMNKNPYNVIVSPLYAVYSPINKYIGYILDSYFESAPNTNNYLSSLVQKGAKNTINITNDTFVSKAVFLPTEPAEQEKIASCLTAMDAIITAQAQRLEALKGKKKGLLQQLFPQQGKSTPRLRFPGFSGDWNVSKLGKLTSFSQGIQVPLPEQSLEMKNGYSRFLRIVDYTQGKEAPRYVPITDKRYWITKNEIAMVRYGTPGYVCIGLEGILANNLFKVNINDIKVLDCSYLSYVLKSDLFQSEIKQKSGGGALNAISFGLIKDILIPVPLLSEQKRIAQCLSVMDDIISAESAKLDSLKDYKKGLMQQLFPQSSK